MTNERVPDVPPRSTKEFSRKEEAAAFIRKTPHLINHGAAGCYRLMSQPDR
jgi:hypothetical protein